MKICLNFAFTVLDLIHSLEILCYLRTFFLHIFNAIEIAIMQFKKKCIGIVCRYLLTYIVNCSFHRAHFQESEIFFGHVVPTYMQLPYLSVRHREPHALYSQLTNIFLAMKLDSIHTRNVVVVTYIGSIVCLSKKRQHTNCASVIFTRSCLLMCCI